MVCSAGASSDRLATASNLPERSRIPALGIRLQRLQGTAVFLISRRDAGVRDGCHGLPRSGVELQGRPTGTYYYFWVGIVRRSVRQRVCLCR